MTDIMTFLTCADKGAIATKKFFCGEDKVIHKTPYSSGMNFTREEIKVSDIHELAKVIQEREGKPTQVLIRGIAGEGAPETTPRRLAGNEGGIFYDPGKLWTMFDIDDFELPKWINPAQEPEAAAKWVRAALPKPFRKVTCFYQFSSGQNVPKRMGEEPPKIAKLHLFFWLDRRITSEQWRDYINGQNKN